jgi:hypothetical protein
MIQYQLREELSELRQKNQSLREIAEGTADLATKTRPGNGD